MFAEKRSVVRITVIISKVKTSKGKNLEKKSRKKKSRERRISKEQTSKHRISKINFLENFLFRNVKPRKISVSKRKISKDVLSVAYSISRKIQTASLLAPFTPSDVLAFYSHEMFVFHRHFSPIACPSVTNDYLLLHFSSHLI